MSKFKVAAKASSSALTAALRRLPPSDHPGPQSCEPSENTLRDLTLSLMSSLGTHGEQDNKFAFTAAKSLRAAAGFLSQLSKHKAVDFSSSDAMLVARTIAVLLTLPNNIPGGGASAASVDSSVLACCKSAFCRKITDVILCKISDYVIEVSPLPLIDSFPAALSSDLMQVVRDRVYFPRIHYETGAGTDSCYHRLSVLRSRILSALLMSYDSVLDSQRTKSLAIAPILEVTRFPGGLGFRLLDVQLVDSLVVSDEGVVGMTFSLATGRCSISHSALLGAEKITQQRLRFLSTALVWIELR